MKLVASVVLGALAGVLPMSAETWSSWRGPNGNGSIAKGETPMEFSLEKNLKWKVELPGRGCSTPIVIDGTILVTAPIEDNDGVVAYDLKGKELWRASYGKATPGRGKRVGSSANSSPASDGEHVFVLFKSGQLAALTLEGKKMWDVNIFETYGENKLWWDYGTSPVLAGGNLVVPMMQTDAPSYLVALDPKTGKKVWKVSRQFETGVESGDAYTTPHVIKQGGKDVIVCFGADHLTGHDAATGEQLWVCGGINPKKMKAWRVIASSVLSHDIAVVPIARGGIVGGIRLGEKGDVTETNWLWREKMAGSDSSTLIEKDGKVFILCDRGKDRGTVTCLDAETGKVRWEDKLPKSAQTYYASPILVGDRLYCPREDGVILFALLGDKGFEKVTENPVEEPVIASPAVVGDHLLIRGSENLFCFGAE